MEPHEWKQDLIIDLSILGFKNKILVWWERIKLRVLCYLAAKGGEE